MKTALLMDDNLMSSGRIEAQLKNAGFSVKMARKVPESGDFSVVLINLASRPLNGIELIAPCHERFPNAKIAGFCGHLEVEIRQKAKELGLSRLLTNDEAMTRLGEWLA